MLTTGGRKLDFNAGRFGEALELTRLRLYQGRLLRSLDHHPSTRSNVELYAIAADLAIDRLAEVLLSDCTFPKLLGPSFGVDFAGALLG